MNTKDLKIFLNKFISLEKKLSDERGDFVLFGLFLRDDAPDVWDVVVSAPWLEKGNMESLRFVTKHIRAELELRELLKVSTVLILDPSQEFVKEMHDEAIIEHGNVKITDYVFDGMHIEKAHIITSNPEAEWVVS